MPLSPTLSSIIKTLLKHVPSLALFGSFSRPNCLLHISSFFLWHQRLTFAFFSFLSIGPFVSYYTNYYHSISLPFCYSSVLLGIIPFFYYNILLFYQSTFLLIYYSINLLFYQSTILSIYYTIILLYYHSTIPPL